MMQVDSLHAILIFATWHVGTSGHYVVAATYPIIGTLRRTSTKLCDYNATSLMCEPTVPCNLTKGDYIDFKFGLYHYQIVKFRYGIIGNGTHGL